MPTDPIEITLSDRAKAILLAGGGIPPFLLAAAAKEIDRQNELTVGHIQANRLSKRGADTLGVVTNRLRLSVRPSKAVIKGNLILSSIGTPVEYAGAHEFGFEGRVSVAAHTRLRNGDEDDKIQVRAHTRQMKIKARAPLQRGIRDRIDRYGSALSSAIIRSWEERAT